MAAVVARRSPVHRCPGEIAGVRGARVVRGVERRSARTRPAIAGRFPRSHALMADEYGLPGAYDQSLLWLSGRSGRGQADRSTETGLVLSAAPRFSPALLPGTLARGSEAPRAFQCSRRHKATMTKPAKRSTLVAFAGATAVWLVLCGVILMPIWPFVSPGRLQWILLVVLGPPFYAIGNYLGGRVLKQRAGAPGGNLPCRADAVRHTGDADVVRGCRHYGPATADCAPERDKRRGTGSCSRERATVERCESKSLDGRACSRAATARSVGATVRSGRTTAQPMSASSAKRGATDSYSWGGQGTEVRALRNLRLRHELGTQTPAQAELHGRQCAQPRTRRPGGCADPSARRCGHLEVS